MKSLLVHSNEFALKKTRARTRRNSCTRAPRLRLFEKGARPLERLFQLLLTLKHRPEQVALAPDAPEHVLDVEVAGLYPPALDLRPFQRRGDGRTRLRSHGVGRDDRLAARVLHVVNVDHPPTALALRALHGRRVRALARNDSRHTLGEFRDLPVAVDGLHRHVDVKPARARSLRVGLEADAFEHVARDDGDLADGFELDALARIEVEDEPVGVV